IRREDEGSDFVAFSKKCEEVRSTSGKLAKTKIVSDYFLSLKSDEDLRIASTFLSGKIFAPGSDEQEINVGYSMIWKSVASFHSLKDGDLSSYYLKHGDLGSAIEDYMNSGKTSKRARSSLLFESDLTLQNVYSAFKELAKASGKGSTERRQKIIERL